MYGWLLFLMVLAASNNLAQGFISFAASLTVRGRKGGVKRRQSSPLMLLTGSTGATTRSLQRVSGYPHYHPVTVAVTSQRPQQGRISQRQRCSSPVSSTSLSSTASASLTPSFYLTRIVFLRALAFVYFVAFTIALRQNKALIGDEGITPARYELMEARDRARVRRRQRQEWLEGLLNNDNTRNKEQRPLWTRLKLQRQNKALIGDEGITPARYELIEARDQAQGRNANNRRQSQRPLWTRLQLQMQNWNLFQQMREIFWDRADRLGRPLLTVFWLANNNYNRLNPWLDGVAITGMTLAAFMGITGAANVPLLLTLWICQRSLMAVGQCWYGFGWEPQLAELGFHALFLVPLLSLQPIPAHLPLPSIVNWTIRWHLFRIMMGAGLIKFKSNDKKWSFQNLTAMNYFYQTQPVPSVLTKTMHFLPVWWHKCEVVMNHFVEVVAPWFLILPVGQGMHRMAGLVQLAFQSILICTGNLSFLNWLTMVPAILCLDDAVWRPLFSQTRVLEASIAAAAYSSSLTRNIVSMAFGGLVAWLSWPVIQNLLSPRQQMNASFDPLRLINSYGAFGVVDEVREEWIISSSTTGEENGDWKEYEFKVKPGSVNRRPRWITPYHYRLDWQMWIAASCRTMERSPWMYPFLVKLLQRDPGVRQLLAQDPWEHNGDKEAAPKYIRVDAYKYQFHRGNNSNKEGPYWERGFLRRVYPLQGAGATLDSLQGEIQSEQPNRPV